MTRQFPGQIGPDALEMRSSAFLGDRQHEWHQFATRIPTLYTFVIKSFRHKGLGEFFRSGSKAGIQPRHAQRLRLQLGRLDASDSPAAMALPGWRLHPLKGSLVGYWAVWVDKHWRLTFHFSGPHAFDVDYQDYH